jgi:hypothetical protein
VPSLAGVPISTRIEFLTATLRLAQQEGTDEALHHASFGVESLFDEGATPGDRAELYVSVPPDLMETFCAAYALIPRELRARWKREMAAGYEEMAREAEADGDHEFADAARANVAPQRRAARALASNGTATPALRDARRVSTKSLNRVLRNERLPTLRVPRRLRASCEHRYRRTPGRKPVRRSGSRRTPAPTRGDPDPDGDPEPPAPSPGAGWQARLGAVESIDAAFALPIRKEAAR